MLRTSSHIYANYNVCIDIILQVEDVIIYTYIQALLTIKELPTAEHAHTPRPKALLLQQLLLTTTDLPNGR